MSELKTRFGRAAWMTLFRTPLYSERAMKVLEAARARAEKCYRLAKAYDCRLDGDIPVLKLYAKDSKRDKAKSLYYYKDEPRCMLDGRIGLQLRVDGAIKSSSDSISDEHAMFIQDEFKRYGLKLDAWRDYPELEIYDGVKAKDAACVCKLLAGEAFSSVSAEFGEEFAMEIVGVPANMIIVEKRRHLQMMLDDAYKAWYSLYYERETSAWKLNRSDEQEMDRRIADKHKALDKIVAELENCGKN